LRNADNSQVFETRDYDLTAPSTGIEIITDPFDVDSANGTTYISAHYLTKDFSNRTIYYKRGTGTSDNQLDINKQTASDALPVVFGYRGLTPEQQTRFTQVSGVDDGTYVLETEDLIGTSVSIAANTIDVLENEVYQVDPASAVVALSEITPVSSTTETLVPAIVALDPQDISLTEAVTIAGTSIIVDPQQVTVSATELLELTVEEFTTTMNNFTVGEVVFLDLDNFTATIEAQSISLDGTGTESLDPASANVTTNDVDIEENIIVNLDGFTTDVDTTDFNISEVIQLENLAANIDANELTVAEAITLNDFDVTTTTNDIIFDTQGNIDLEGLAANIDTSEFTILELIEFVDAVDVSATANDIEVLGDEVITLEAGSVFMTTNHIYDGITEEVNLTSSSNSVQMHEITAIENNIVTLASTEITIDTNDITLLDVVLVEIHRHQFIEPSNWVIKQRAPIKRPVIRL